jgi:hypothetical protein
LRWRLANSRQLRTARVTDGLWVRLLDLQAALAARGYAADGALVLEVADPLRPRNQGRFRFKPGRPGATCAPTDADPDQVRDVAGLRAAWLGGMRLTSLARAGRVRRSSQAHWHAPTPCSPAIRPLVDLSDQGDLDRARTLYERTVAIRKARLRADHPDTTQSLTNLAGVLHAQDNLQDARSLLERALALYQACLGPDHRRHRPIPRAACGGGDGAGESPVAG